MSGLWMVEPTTIALTGAALTFALSFSGLLLGYDRWRLWRARQHGPASHTRWDAVAHALGLEPAPRRLANLGGVHGAIGDLQLLVGAHATWKQEATRFVAPLPQPLARRLTITPRPNGATSPLARFDLAYHFADADGLKAGQALTPDLAQIFLSFHRDGIPLTLLDGTLSFQLPRVGLEDTAVAHLTNQLLATANLLQRHLHEAALAPDRSTVVFGAYDPTPKLQTRWATVARRTGLDLIRCDEDGERLLTGQRGDCQLLVSEQPGDGLRPDDASTLGVSHAVTDHTTFRVVLPRDAACDLRIIPTVRGGASPIRTGDADFDALYAVSSSSPQTVEPLLGAAIRASFVAFGRDGCPVELHGPFLTCELDAIHCTEQEIVDHLERLHALATTLVRAFELAERCATFAPWAFAAAA